MIVTVIANAAEEGGRFREIDMADSGQVSAEEIAGMEQYLGPSTIARLRDSEEGDAAASQAATGSAPEAAASPTEATVQAEPAEVDVAAATAEEAVEAVSEEAAAVAAAPEATPETEEVSATEAPAGE